MALPLDKSKVKHNEPGVVIIPRIMSHEELGRSFNWYDKDDASQIDCGSLKIIAYYHARWCDIPWSPLDQEGTASKIYNKSQIVTRIEYIAKIKGQQ